MKNYAERIVLKNKIKQRRIDHDDLKFKVFGKERFESKINYCDQNIQNLLRYFSPTACIHDDHHFYWVRK